MIEHKDVTRLEQMIDDIRAIRERTCEPKRNTNPRYLALSSAISQLNRAIEDLRAEDS
jgi:hypothetical protein